MCRFHSPLPARPAGPSSSTAVRPHLSGSEFSHDFLHVKTRPGVFSNFSRAENRFSVRCRDRPGLSKQQNLIAARPRPRAVILRVPGRRSSSFDPRGRDLAAAPSDPDVRAGPRLDRDSAPRGPRPPDGRRGAPRTRVLDGGTPRRRGAIIIMIAAREAALRPGACGNNCSGMPLSARGPWAALETGTRSEPLGTRAANRPLRCSGGGGEGSKRGKHRSPKIQRALARRPARPPQAAVLQAGPDLEPPRTAGPEAAARPSRARRPRVSTLALEPT